MAVSRSAADKTGRRGKGTVLNPLGLPKIDYRGRPSTLCKGCGHDSVSQRIINVTWEQGLAQHNVVKDERHRVQQQDSSLFLAGQSWF